MRWSTIAIMLLAPCFVLAQSVKLLSVEGLSVCGSASLKIEIDNNTADNINSLFFDLQLPCGVSYVENSVEVLSESNLSDLNNPSFSLPSLFMGESFIICMEVVSSCDSKVCIDDGVLFQHSLQLTSDIGISNYTSPIYNVETANPIIRKIDAPFLKAIKNQTIERKVTIRNTRPGRLSELTFTDTYSGNFSISSNFEYQNSGQTHTTTIVASDFLNVGNMDAYLDYNEEIELIEYITVKSCPLDNRYIKSDLEVSWGCDGQYCSSYDSKAIIEVELKGDEDDVIRTREWVYNPYCDGDTLGRRQRLEIRNSGSINDLVNVAIKINSASGYSIKEGTVELSGNIDYNVVYDNTQSCYGVGGATINIERIPAASLFNIYWYMPSCEFGCEANQLSWSYSYNYEKECAPVEDRFINGNPMQVGNSSAPVIEAGLLIERGGVSETIAVGDSLLFTMTIDHPSLESGTGSVKYELDLPCKFTIVQADYEVGGVSPSSIDVTNNGDLQTLSLEYPLPFTSDIIDIPVLIRIDNNPACGIDCLVQYLTSCPDQDGVANKKKVKISYLIKLDNSGDCLIPLSSCGEEVLIYTAAGPICPMTPPGYVDYTFDIYRTTYGLPDNDNDHFPDDNSSLDLSAINLQSFIWGDTIQIKVIGVVVKELQSAILSNAMLRLYYQDGIGYGANSVNPDNINWFKWLFLEGGLRRTNSLVKMKNSSFEPIVNIDYEDEFIGIDLSFDRLSNYVDVISQNGSYVNGDSIAIHLEYVMDKNPAQLGISNNTYVVALREFFRLKPFFAVDSEKISENSFTCDLNGYECSISGGNLPSLISEEHSINNLTPAENVQYCDTTFMSAFSVFGIHGAKAPQSWGYDLFPNEFRQIWSADSIELLQFEGAILDSVMIERKAYKNRNSSVIIYDPPPKILISDYIDIRQDLNVGYNYLCFYSSTSCHTDLVRNNVSATFIPTHPNGILSKVSNLLFVHPEPKILFPSADLELESNILYQINSIVDVKANLIFNGKLFNPFSLPPSLPLMQAAYMGDSSSLVSVWGPTWNTTSNDSISVFVSGNLVHCDNFFIPIQFGAYCDSIISSFQEPCLVWDDVIYVEVQKGLIEMVDLSPTQEIDLCAVNEQRFTIINADLGNLEHIITEQRVAPGFKIVPGSVEVAFPSGSNNWVSIPDPTFGNQKYNWDWDILLQGINLSALQGVNSIPENGFDIKYQYKTDCDFISGTKMIYRSFATQHCGDPTNIIAKVSGAINIAGLEDSDALVNLELLSFNSPDCEVEGELSLAINHSNITIEDSLYFVIPGAYTLSNADIGLVDRKDRFTYPLSDLESIDTLNFDISYSDSSVQCGQDIFSIYAATGNEAFCVESNMNCSIGQLNGQIDIPINIDLPLLEIIDFQITESVDGYYSFSISIENQGNTSLDSVRLDLIVDDDVLGVESFDFEVSSHTLFGPFLPFTSIEVELDSISLDLEDLCDLFLSISADSNCVCRSDFEYLGTPIVSSSLLEFEFCEGQEIIIGVPDNGHQYLWSGDLDMECDTCATIKVLTDGYIDNTADYYFKLVEYIDFGCYIEKEIRLSILATPQILNGDITICYGDSVTIFAGVGDSYTWAGSDIFYEEGNEIKANPSATSDYIVAVGSENGCEGRDTVTVTVLEELFIPEFDNLSVCYGLDVQIETPSIFGLNFSIYSPTLNFDRGNDIYISDYGIGSHEVLIQVDNGLCSLNDTIIVSWYDGLEVENNYDTSTVCVGEELEFDFNADYTYQWFPSQTDMCFDDNCSNIQWKVQEGIQLIKGLTSNDEGCIDTVLLVINGYADTLTYDMDTLVCKDDAFMWRGIEIIDSGNYCDTIKQGSLCLDIYCLEVSHHPWTDTTYVEENICLGQTIEFDTTSYSDDFEGLIKLRNRFGCDSIIALRIEVDDILSRDSSITLCYGDSLLWMDTYYDSEIILWDTIVNMEGCLEEQGLYVYIADDFDVEHEILPQSIEALGEINETFASEMLTYQWSDGSTNSNLLSLESGFYSLTVTNIIGCEKYFDFEVLYDYKENQFAIPNIFHTDSSNPKNSRFFIEFPTFEYQVVEFIIFDRWGNLIFDCNNTTCATEGWDGNFKGVEVVSGVYVYKLVYTLGSESFQKYGSVTKI